MSERNLIIVTKVIAYYCAFYMGVKLYAVMSGAPNANPQLVLAGVLFFIAFAGFYLLKKNRQNWPFAIFGVIAVSALRYFEQDLLILMTGWF